MSTVLEASDPDTAAVYAIDWQDQLIQDAEREHDFAEGEFIQAQFDTGWMYECTTAGRSARSYPNSWARAAGETTVDGSVIWTCRHPADAVVPTITSAVWSLETGLTLDSQVEINRVTEITVSGGVDGNDYDATCRMTASNGKVLERTIVIPRRAE